MRVFGWSWYDREGDDQKLYCLKLSGLEKLRRLALTNYGGIDQRG
jgi:hypothetical protein